MKALSVLFMIENVMSATDNTGTPPSHKKSANNGQLQDASMRQGQGFTHHLASPILL